MIQRIQSLWLLLAALCGAGLFYFDLYTAHTLVNNIDMQLHIRVNDDYLSLIIALLLTLLPLFAIFLYKKRKQQRLVAVLDILASIGFIALMLMRVNTFTAQNPTATRGSYSVGAILPILSVIFIILALRGIRKDEKLVRSLDRLR